ncbi:hypothetical protein [Anoxybacter fermentans]|uniref:hypothetical protein n=1 Tax=Anoxybacter fermentans TaxID=1323375 RepID=UPI0013DF729A|nr:hypothetical protein [Anoxybacter fermentans]
MKRIEDTVYLSQIDLDHVLGNWVDGIPSEKFLEALQEEAKWCGLDIDEIKKIVIDLR